MQEHRPAFEALGATVVAVGFSPGPALAALADQLGWPWAFLADPERVLYGRLGLERASLRQVFAPAAVRRYREAAAQGYEVSRPVEDPRQLGADVIAVDGRVVWLRRQVSSDDRPPVATVLEVAAGFALPGAAPS
ncbi:MAG: AhpC/TSA family protein [Acidimicrobiales bacterium]